MRTRKQRHKKRRHNKSNNKMDREFHLESLKNISRQREEHEIKKDFKRLDRDRSGFIDLNELREGLKRYGIKLSSRQTRHLMRRYDDDPDNKLEMREFVQLKRDINAKSFRKSKRQQKLRR